LLTFSSLSWTFSLYLFPNLTIYYDLRIVLALVSCERSLRRVEHGLLLGYLFRGLVIRRVHRFSDQSRISYGYLFPHHWSGFVLCRFCNI